MAQITRKQFLHVGFLLTVTIASCKKPTLNAAPSSSETKHQSGYLTQNLYGFHHHETTGITSYLQIGEREQAIDFADDSDTQALNRLYGLRPDVFLPLTDGKHLFVVGELSKTELWTPGGANRATKESYRDLRLHDWYIVAPFEEWKNLESMEQPKTIPRTELRLTDFDARTTSDLKFEPSRYQKTQGEHHSYVARFADR